MANLQRRPLPRETVLEAAVPEFPPGTHLEASNPGGKKHVVELFSTWGWGWAYFPDKAALTRRIADRLQRAGYLCSFDTIDATSFRAVFTLETL